jgi:hypothetical protein
VVGDCDCRPNRDVVVVVDDLGRVLVVVVEDRVVVVVVLSGSVVVVIGSWAGGVGGEGK